MKFLVCTKRRLFQAWGVLSCLWVAGVAILVSPDLIETYEPIERAKIGVEARDEQAFEGDDIDKLLDELLGGINYDSPTAYYPNRKFDESSPDFQKLLGKARKNFPSFDGQPDANLLQHIEKLVANEVWYIDRNMKDRRKSLLAGGGAVAVLPPALTLAVGALGVWLRRRYPPETLPPYTKKVIAIAITWILAAMAWAVIEQEGDIGDVFGDEYPLVFFLPPAVFVVAASLWAWARREPSPNQQEAQR